METSVGGGGGGGVGVGVGGGVVGVGVVVVEWLYCSKRVIIVRWADLSDFFFR